MKTWVPIKNCLEFHWKGSHYENVRYSGRHLVQQGHLFRYLALVLSQGIAKVLFFTKMEENKYLKTFINKTLPVS